LSKLEGKRIALVGQRKVEELSKLVENLGGIPLVRPAQGTVFLDDSNLELDILTLIKGSFQWMIFTTGIGLQTLYNTAEEMGHEADFIAAMENANVAARGYKTVNTLKKLGITPIVKDDDGSTAGLVRQLSVHDLKGCRVALQLHGDPAPKLIEWLDTQGCEYKEVLPYQHVAPEKETMERLISELLNGKIDAVNFTSTPQGRFLMSFAREKGVEKEILKKFSSDVVAVAVGKVTAQALREEGIDRLVVPEHERMGSAIMELVKYYEGKSF
jgi:uroporphyrinogen-III synthase